LNGFFSWRKLGGEKTGVIHGGSMPLKKKNREVQGEYKEVGDKSTKDLAKE
jgi:hypothetical protein